MAKLGFRTINEMVGRSDLLKVDDTLRNPKTANLDLSALLKPAWQMRPGAATFKSKAQDHKLHTRLDNKVSLLEVGNRAPKPSADPLPVSQSSSSSRTTLLPRATPFASSARSSTPTVLLELLSRTTSQGGTERRACRRTRFTSTLRDLLDSPSAPSWLLESPSSSRVTAMITSVRQPLLAAISASALDAVAQGSH